MVIWALESFSTLVGVIGNNPDYMLSSNVVWGKDIDQGEDLNISMIRMLEVTHSKFFSDWNMKPIARD